MSNTCRTCSQTIINVEYFHVDGSSFASSELQVRDILKWCIPELNMELMPDSVLCKNCMLTLHITYQFRVEVLRNEDTFYNQLESPPPAQDINDECVDINDTSDVEIDSDAHLKEEIFYGGMNDVKEIIEVVNEVEEASDGDTDVNKVNNTEENDAEVAREDNTEGDEIELEAPELQEDCVQNYIKLEIPKKSRNIRRPFKCSLCNFCSNSNAGLIMHQRIHTGETPFHCPYCSYKAKRKAHLDGHVKQHTGERPYKCNACGKQFSTNHMLKSHQRIHTGERPYRCLQCNFRSRHKTSIANHVKRIHFGLPGVHSSQPYVCYICGKTLAGTASLTAHMRIHSGTKSHLCELCGKYFREKNMLRNHLRVHTGEKPFKCTNCDYVSNRKAHLKDHMKLHDGRTELFPCTLCGKRYITVLLMKKHFREEHKEEEVKQQSDEKQQEFD